MIGSDVFSRSPQLGAFLRFVVEAVLHGKADRIKAYTIGVEVLRRDTRFDPQLDPIVRVEATRLRRAIERYYAGPGADRSGHHRSAARLLRADLPAARDGASPRGAIWAAIGRWADSAATAAASRSLPSWRRSLSLAVAAVVLP